MPGSSPLIKTVASRPYEQKTSRVVIPPEVKKLLGISDDTTHIVFGIHKAGYVVIQPREINIEFDEEKKVDID